MAYSEVGGRVSVTPSQPLVAGTFHAFVSVTGFGLVTDIEPLESLPGKDCDGVTDGDGVSSMESFLHTVTKALCL